MKYKMIILLLFWPLLSSAENFYKVRLHSVYDGDTFKVSLACRYSLFCKKISVRVNGIDCPELRTKDTCEKQAAQKAKEFSEDFLQKGPIILRNCQKDKYFRLLCNVFVRFPTEEPTKKQEQNLAQALLNKKLAVPYDGGTKQKIDWCIYYQQGN